MLINIYIYLYYINEKSFKIYIPVHCCTIYILCIGHIVFGL